MNIAVNTISEQLKNQIRDAAFDARAHKGEVLSADQRTHFKDKIKKLLRERDAVLVVHYYVDSELQILAEETGGCVSDSLEMARFGYEHPASTVVVAGVKFMGETAKILSPEKKILLVEDKADCSLDLGCPAEQFSAYCDQHPDREVVVYANTSAAVKARADWVATSSIALKLIKHLHEQGKKVLWAPDKYLGDYVQRQTGADMIMWDAACVVHEEFKATALQSLMKQQPDAKVLVHPESPADVIALADVVGSTSQLIQASKDLGAKKYIVATEMGIYHKMKQVAGAGIELMPAPTAGEGATCESCANCPWMKMNDLKKMANVLEYGSNEILIDEAVRKQAQVSLKRMVEFGKKAGVTGRSSH